MRGTILSYRSKDTRTDDAMNFVIELLDNPRTLRHYLRLVESDYSAHILSEFASDVESIDTVKA